MKKHYYLFGLVVTGLLFLGGLSFPVLAQDDGGPGEMPGTYEIDYDLSLTNVWDSGPVGHSPTGYTNMNLWYNVSSMVSPLDQFFNVGNIIPMLPPDEGGIPSFAIDGTFENSKLFVKVVNDQNDLIDWQAALMLGEDINISWEFPEPPPTGTGAQDGPEIPFELLPTSFVLPAGTSTPPFPVVRSTTNFSQYFDFSQLVHNYGYDGVPFLSPGIFLLENVTDAWSFWENEFDLSQMPLPFAINVTTEHSGVGSSFNLTFETEMTNGTHTFGNASIWASWNSTGFLEMFEFMAFLDMNENYVLDSEEEISFFFELEKTEQEDIPVSVGDSGKYVMNTFLNLTVDLVDDTENADYQAVLDGLEAAINALDGRHLLNYTIDSIDGLYYHLDGYIFMLEKFMKEHLWFLPGFGPETTGNGAQNGFPEPPTFRPVEEYYIPISEMVGGPQDSSSDFAINMFDNMPYQNTTEFYRGFGGHYWWDDMGNQQFEPLRADNDTHMRLPVGPGVVWIDVFENADWEYQWDRSQVSFMENYANKLGSGKRVPTPQISYIEVQSMYWDEFAEDWLPETYWDNDAQAWLPVTHLESWIIAGPATFVVNTDYYAVVEISELPGLGYTTYRTDQSPYMMLRMGGSDSGPGPQLGGIGAQNNGPDDGGPPIRPEQALPFPVRTPDWDIIGGTYDFIEAIVAEVSAMYTDEAFLSFLTEQFLGQSDKNDLNIDTFTFGLVWTEDAVNVGMTANTDLVMQITVDEPENEIFRDFDIDLTSVEEYLWNLDGSFDTVSSASDIWLDYNFTDYHVEPPPSSSSEPTSEPTSTSSEESTVDLSPGFEILLALSGIIAIPIIYRRRR
ncbi:MAG: Heimdall-CTERM domain-containing surface protein [Candidatus Hodarchaeales archaeon]|jgi:hypothetical protein